MNTFKPFIVYGFTDSPFERYQSKTLRFESISELIGFYRFLLYNGYVYDYQTRSFTKRVGIRYFRVMAFS